jgi:hypothetical protein
MRNIDSRSRSSRVDYCSRAAPYFLARPKQYGLTAEVIQQLTQVAEGYTGSCEEKAARGMGSGYQRDRRQIDGDPCEIGACATASRERGSRNDRKICATKAIDAKTLCCAMWFCADGAPLESRLDT